MKISITELSPQSFARAAAQVRTYARSLEDKLSELVRRLAELGMNTVVSIIESDKYETGRLLESVSLEVRDDHTYLVVVDSPYVAYVEFGTGVVGQGTYEGELPTEWSYNTMHTPSAHDKLDPTIWYYFDDYFGFTRFTRGQVAGNFMATASVDMRNAALSIAREVFS